MGETAPSSRYDCSKVPVWELAPVLTEYVERMRAAAEDYGGKWDLTLWTEPIDGLSPRQVTRITKYEEPFVGLRMVDLICHAMGRPELMHTFTFIPANHKKYAREMAREEWLAESDEEPPKDYLKRRSAELAEMYAAAQAKWLDLRESLLADPKASVSPAA